MSLSLSSIAGVHAVPESAAPGAAFMLSLRDGTATVVRLGSAKDRDRWVAELGRALRGLAPATAATKPATDANNAPADAPEMEVGPKRAGSKQSLALTLTLTLTLI